MSKIMSPFLALSFATVLSDFSLFILLSFGQVGSKRKRRIERERERHSRRRKIFCVFHPQ